MNESTFRALVKHLIAHQKYRAFLLEYQVVPFSALRTIQGFRTTFYPKSKFERRAANFFANIMSTRRCQVEVQETSIISLPLALLGAGSDVIEYEGNFYLDRLDFAISDVYYPSADANLFEFQTNKVALKNWSQVSTGVIQDAIWLAYPGTSHWGHFFAEVILRLSVITQGNPDFNARVILLSDANRNFGKFLTILFPKIMIIEVTFGKLYEGVNIKVLPSTSFFPIKLNEKFTNQDLTWGDPRAIVLLRQLCWSALERNNFTKALFPKLIFLNRNSSGNRPSLVETSLICVSESYGYTSIDPGSLNPLEEINLCFYAEYVVGSFGSQLLLANIATNLRSMVIVDGNYRSDIGYFDLVCKHANRIDLKVIPCFKKRRNFFGENSIQQPIQNVDQLVVQLEKVLSQIKIVETL
jgi:hypothetical protein